MQSSLPAATVIKKRKREESEGLPHTLATNESPQGAAPTPGVGTERAPVARASRPRSSLYLELEASFRQYREERKGQPVLDADDSDDEQPREQTSSSSSVSSSASHVDEPTSSSSSSSSSASRADKEEKAKPHVAPLVHKRSPHSSEMTMVSTYHGRTIRFKGNQLILWVRQMMTRLVSTSRREEKIAAALKTSQATIQNPEDWLDYEGMFDSFENMPAKPSKPFVNGMLTIFLRPMVSTIVSFRNKINKKKLPDGRWIEENSNMLYAHLADKNLIKHLSEKFGLKKYNYPSNCGMSYTDIVGVISKFKAESKKTDVDIAKQQLEVLACKAEDQPLSRFLAYFNAILFGSEASRNSVSFVTGVITLKLIADGKLTYAESFKTPDSTEMQDAKATPRYAVYPMASPYHDGPGNVKGYKKLVELSQQEAASSFALSSSIGMKASRQRPQWSQIQLKEAILLKHWGDDSSDYRPGWLNSGSHAETGQAVEFARQFNQRIALLLYHYWGTIKQYVYSSDELSALGGDTPRKRVWQDPDNSESTVVNFAALTWYFSSAQPLKLEKIMQDAYWEVYNDVMGSLDEEPAASPPSPG